MLEIRLLYFITFLIQFLYVFIYFDPKYFMFSIDLKLKMFSFKPLLLLKNHASKIVEVFVGKIIK